MADEVPEGTAAQVLQTGAAGAEAPATEASVDAVPDRVASGHHRRAQAAQLVNIDYEHVNLLLP